MMPGLLIGALLLVGGGCWIGVAASFAARWQPAFSSANTPTSASAWHGDCHRHYGYGDSPREQFRHARHRPHE